VNETYDYERLFLVFGGGIVVVSAIAVLGGCQSFGDFAAALLAGYVLLRITNTMRQEDTQYRRRR